ncbi:MAG TPA: MFS transporter [Jatrophihabitans sp.]|nr:MFS transporter [Jatrophihabitans sp.]
MLTRKERLTLLVLLGAGFMLSLDFSILNVALPEAGDGVGIGTDGLPWITSAYSLPAAGCTLLFGRVADLHGRRKVFLAGLVVLILGCLIGGFATTPAMLLAGRAMQGLAAAMTIPASLSLITTTFAEGPVRDRVLGLNGALLCAGFTVGALAGGTLISVLGWRAAFLINVPIAVLIVVITPALVEESAVAQGMRLDLPGALTVSGGLMAVVYAVLEANIAIGVVGAVLLVAFWKIEHRAPQPLASIRILKRRTVLWGNYAGFVLLAMVPGMIFLVTLYLQQVLGLSPFATGLVFGLPGLASIAAGVVAGRLIGRHGSRVVLAVSMSVTALATVPLVFLGTDRSAQYIVVPALFVCFFGHVAAIVAYTVIGTSGLPPEEQGLASGLNTMTNQASSIGIPVLGAIAASQSVLLTGIHLALIVDIVVTLVNVAVVWVGLRARPSHQVLPFAAAAAEPNRAAA